MKVKWVYMDHLQTLQRIFADSDGKRFGIEFIDGDACALLVVSSSHVLLNSTVWGVPLPPESDEAPADEPGIQFYLQEVLRVSDFDTKHLLFGPDVGAKKAPGSFLEHDDGVRGGLRGLSVPIVPPKRSCDNE